jgi:opacity protein-like surface antigen
MIAAPLATQAQPANPPPVTGLYISLGAGGNILMDEHLVNAAGTASDARLRSRIGVATVAAVGYGLGNGIRLELEGDYRNNRFSQGRDFGFPAAAGGNEIKYGPMFNALYDLTGLIPFPYAAPYAGLGVGYQWAHFDNVHAYGAGAFPRFSSDDTRGALAYQAIIGAVIPFQFLPQLATTIEYRFLGLAHRDYDVTASAVPGAAIPGKIKFGNDFNHSLLIGVRYNFGAPPPAVPAAPAPIAAPAPAPARSYLVFFDWDKADLTDRARSLQSGSLGSSCTGGRSRAGTRRRAAERHRGSGLRRHAFVGANRGRCARAAEPTGRDHSSLTLAREQVDSPRQHEGRK